MDAAVQAQLDLVCDTVIKTVNPQAIYLFGSFAYGTPSAESDFDIYVVLDNQGERPLIAMQRIYMALSTAPIRALDVLANTEEKFSQRQGHPSLERTVLEKEVKLYERQQLCQTMA